MKRLLFICVLGGLLLAAGCAAPMRQEPPEPSVPEPEPATPSRPLNSPAVVALSDDARQALASQDYDSAVQYLERAVRIEPSNGALWHEMAKVRFEQGNYEQAMQLANRSNALVDEGTALKARNDKLIEASRSALGY